MFVLGVLLRHIVQLDNYSSYILVGIVVILAAIGLYTMLDYFMWVFSATHLMMLSSI